MTPGRLRTFLAVHDLGSARAAAARLHVTESAVSASLAALGREVGVVLFEREGRGLRPTPAAGVFADYARRILGLLDEAGEAARQDADPGHGRLRIAAVTTAGEYLVPGLLASFRARHPHVRVSLEIGPRDQVQRSLSAHEVDVMIGGRPATGQGLRTWGWRPNDLVVVGRPDVAFDLPHATWLLREAGSGTRAATPGLWASWDAEPPTLALGSHGAVVASAVLGLGVTLTSADAVRQHVEEGRLAVLEAAGTPLRRPWHVVARTSPTPTARLFLAHVSDPDLAGELSFRPGAPRPTARRGPRA